MRYELGEYVFIDAAAFNTSPLFADCQVVGRVIDALPGIHLPDESAINPKRYLVATLAKQFPPTWIEPRHIQGRVLL